MTFKKQVREWWQIRCEYKCCQWATGESELSEPTLMFCTHEKNPEDSEGNCRENICPRLDYINKKRG
jgi:hypothetical protein